MRKGRAIALLPIAVFLVLYLGLGILFEYVMKIPMGFYNVPIVFAFLVAILVACLQNRKVSFDEKLGIMAHGLADKNIITMLLIFLTAGVFVGVVGRSSAECGVFYAVDYSGAVFGGSLIWSSMFCVSGNGNFRWNDYAADTDCGSGIERFRFWTAALRGLCHGRFHVWR